MQIFIGGFCFGLLLHTLFAEDLEDVFNKNPVIALFALFIYACLWGGLAWGLFG